MFRYLVLISLIIISQAGFAKTQVAAHVEFEYGQSYGSDQMNGRLDAGKIYRLKLFGGAKLPKIKFLSAVGLGLDFTYSDFKDKSNTTNFKYQRFTWDWIHIPVNIGIIRLIPGLSWVVTAVNDPTTGINEKSIRPAFSGSIGVGIPVWRFKFLFDLKAMHVFEDTEVTSAGEKINITGNFLSAYAGLGFYF